MKSTKDLKLVTTTPGKRCGITDLFDDYFKSAFNLTDEEYDFFCENMTDEETSVMVNEKPIYSEKRQMISIRTKLINKYNETKKDKKSLNETGS
jgi:hypothetical protein